MIRSFRRRVVGLGRLELPTLRLSGVRSNHLSYRPMTAFAGVVPPGSRSHLDLSSIKMSGKRNEDGGDPLFVGRLATVSGASIARESWRGILRKEVIQPQVPLRLPCYDFTPVTDPTVACCLPKVGTQSSGKTNSHGVTGGVYKARERIHRGMLIHDY